MSNLIARAEIRIHAPTHKVWEALTKPELVKQWLFGTDMITDLTEGSPIVYRGEWKEVKYEDKGTILKVVPEKLFSSTYWSSMSGLPDMPENYNTVTYELFPEDGLVKLVVTQDNIASEESRVHSQQNWRMVLDKIKEIAEK